MPKLQNHGFRSRLTRDKGAAPLYAQVQDLLVEQVHARIMDPEWLLPKEEELAKTFGVSQITVRRAIKELVDARVLQRVKRKGTFVTADYAKRWRDNVGTIGLVFPHTEFWNTASQAMRSALRHRGLQPLEMRYHWADTDEEERVLRACLQQAAGLIVYPSLNESASSYFRELKKRRFPFVFFDMRAPTVSAPCVRSANAQGAAAAARELLDGRFEEYLFLAVQETETTRLRLKGFQNALLEAGYNLPPQNILQAGSKTSDVMVREQLHERLRCGKRMGIFAGGVGEARLCYEYALLDSRQIPDEIGVVGFDDFAEAPLLNPPLTVIRQDQMALAHAAVTLLSRMVEGLPTSSLIEIPTELVRRASVRSAVAAL